MKNTIFLLFISLLFIGCSTGSLNISKNKELIFTYDSSNIMLGNKITDTDFLNIKDLFVTRYKLQNIDGRVLFYEDARTALEYEFNFGGLYTVMYLFDNSQEYYEVYRRNNSRLVQIKLKDARYLNVLIQSSDTQVYSFAYGFSNEEFLKLAQTIKRKDEDKIALLRYKGIVFDSSSEPLSNWSDEVVYFAPLITPLRSLGRH
ncbi:MAG: hypothetical protein U9N33_12805 [Campylobacterota bacterium]|nr:hypothetical protein [Campylobacterota bacterium]